MSENGQRPGLIEESVEFSDELTRRLGDLTREELIDYVRRQYEAGVRIGFPGKNKARRIARKVQPRVVRKIAKYSSGPEEEQARNLLVEGENLQAMTTLYRERGQVDLILTDPPYNTGKDFRYNDKWDEDPNDPDLGELVSETDGARHTKWMKFMWPRLQMMKDMLKPSGVLAICIDQRELFHLGQMLDEPDLFGEENRLSVINWQRSSTRRNDKEHVYVATEYVLVYAKDKSLVSTGLEERPPELDAQYKNVDNDPKGDWLGVGPSAPGVKTHPGMVYAIQSPFTGQLHYPSGHWKAEKTSMWSWLEEWGSKYVETDLDDGRPPALLVKNAMDPRSLEDPSSDPAIVKARKRAEKVRDEKVWPQLFFTTKGFGKPRRKTYLSEVRRGIIPSTFWADEDFFFPLEVGATSWDDETSGTSEAGSRELTAIVGEGHGFETVKPIRLFEKMIQIWCPPDGLVLDPFAGSGTAGHAVIALNKRQGFQRRFILIEQGRPEKGDSYARSLMANRLRRVVEGDWANGKGEPLGGGFRFVALQNKVDAKALLNMERDEMADAVIASYFDDVKRGPGLVNMAHDGHQYLVAKNADDEGFFLVWDGSKEAPVFDEDVYDSVVEEAEKVGLKPTYHVYARYNLYQSDDVRFYQIPNRILMDFGVSTANDAFHNEDAVVPVDLD